MNNQRAIITVVGKDTIGIIAKVCTYLADSGINILDISQTIVQDFFNMMMIVDFSKTDKEFDQIADELDVVGANTGVQIKCQLEDIFDKMHRI
ncbi:MAG: ACT domain-containing protein [Bacteroidaceae bacterium]|nr:ACT domain-containing protein [Bacteroidaceae bacterium]